MGVVAPRRASGGDERVAAGDDALADVAAQVRRVEAMPKVAGPDGPIHDVEGTEAVPVDRASPDITE